MKQIVVNKYGSGDYNTLQEACNFLNTNNIKDAEILVKKGVYNEKVHFKLNSLKIIGENIENTLIIFDDYAARKMEDGEINGTFNTATFFAGCNFFYAQNICFSNNAGKVGQALAFYNDSTVSYFYRCAFKGNQDTLFLGGLPATAQKTGLLHNGIEDYFKLRISVDNPTNSYSYYYQCEIEGTVDFIFGGSCALFDSCRIISKNSTEGYVAAPCTPKDKEGIIFYECNFCSETIPKTVFIARPWRAYGKVSVVKCFLDSHINEEGFDDWQNINHRNTSYFCEAENFGDGATPREKWIKKLNRSEINELTKKTDCEREKIKNMIVSSLR